MSAPARGARAARSSSWLVPAIVLLAACAPEAGPPEPGGALAGRDSTRVSAETPAVGSWTAGVVDIPSGGGISTVVSVRAARHEEFDRVVWELEGPPPGVHVEYVDEPVRGCGSGEPVPLPGDAWLEIRLTPARAHAEDGRATIAERRRATALPVILEIASTCDFEAVVTWVLAVRSPEPFRLTMLEDPSRLVVDVRHPR